MMLIIVYRIVVGIHCVWSIYVLVRMCQFNERVWERYSSLSRGVAAATVGAPMQELQIIN